MGLVEDAIDAYIESVTDNREPDGMIHPSSASLCARRTVYASRAGEGEAEEFDKDTKRKFYIGHRIHEVVQRALEGSMQLDEFCAEPTIILPKPYNMKGSADAIIRRGKKVSIVEVKSIAKGSLRYGGMPKEHHKTQAQMYAFGVQEAGYQYEESGLQYTIFPRPVDSIIYAYLEKENLKVYEYEEEYTATMHTQVGDYLKGLNDYVEDGQALPKRLPVTKAGKKPWPCSYCPFAQKCWQVDPHEIELGAF